MKKLRKILAILMCITLIAPLLPSDLGKVFAAEITGLRLYDRELTAPTANITVDPMPGEDLTGYTFTWNVPSEDQGVITCSGSTSQTVTVTRMGTGRATLNVTATNGVTTQTTSMIITVPAVFDAISTTPTDKDSNGRPTAIYLYTPEDPEYLADPVQKAKEITLNLTYGLSDQVKFSSTNENVVTIDETGLIKAVGAGNAKIDVSYGNDTTGKTSRSVNIVVAAKVIFNSTLRKEFKIPTVSPDPQFHLKQFEEYTIVTNTKPESSEGNKNLLWSSSRTKVATVVDGKLSVHSAGETEITIKPKDGINSIYNAKISLVVDFALSKESVIMNKGDKFNIGTNAVSDGIQYSSSNPSVVSVNEITGLVTANSSGTADIKVTLTDSGLFGEKDQASSTKILYCHVTVVDGIGLDRTQVSINKDTSLKLVAIATSSNEIKWTSSNNSIVTVDSDGTIKGVKSGVTTVTATQVVNGITKSASCEVTVLVPVGKVILNKTSAEIKNIQGEVVSVAVEKFEPDDVSQIYKVINWESSRPDLLKIKEISGTTQYAEYEVTGKGSGYVVLSAVTTNNVVIASCTVLIKEPVKSITIPAAYQDLVMNFNDKKIQLLAEILPVNATDKTIKWKSGDERKATVDETTGMVNFVSTGEVMIMAYSVENKEIFSATTITIQLPVKSIELDVSEFSVAKNGKYRLTSLILPNNASNKKVTWISSDPKIASVDQEGLVTGVSSGKCMITVRTEDGGHIATATCSVVQEVEGITLDVKELEISKGDYYFLQATVLPLNSTDKNIQWTSSNPSIATVNSSGKVVALKVGTTVITARSSKGSMSQCTVYVKQPVTLVKMNVTTKEITVGNSFKLSPTVYPSDASTKTLAWTSSDTSVATVDKNGKIKALKGGKTIVSAKASSGAWDLCTITVIEKVASIKLNHTSGILYYGYTFKLTAKITNSTASNKGVTWSSSNKKIATVDSKGNVIAVGTGKVTITCTAKDGSGKKATCKLQVVSPVTSVKLNRKSFSIIEGKTTKLTSSVFPSTASIKKLNWSSDDESIVKVSSNGTVSAISPGVATITITSTDGTNKKATCLVTVKKSIPTTSINVLTNAKGATLLVGETTTIQVKVSPTNANDKIKFTSNNKAVATVDQTTGKVVAKSPGTAIIDITSDNGVTSSCTVSVIGFERTSLTLEQYSSHTLVVFGASEGITWDIQNPEIAVVKNGKVDAKKIGTTYVIASLNGKKIYCKLTVTKIS